MNIKLRLTLWYTTILFFMLLFFSGLIYASLTYSLRYTIDNHLEREVAQIVDNIQIRRNLDDLFEDDDDEYHFKPSGPMLIIDGAAVILNYTPEEGVFWRVQSDNGLTMLNPEPLDTATIAPLSMTEPTFDYATLPDGRILRLYSLPLTLAVGKGAVQVAESYAYVQTVQQQLLVFMALTIPLILLLASVSGWFLANRALAPIDRITRAAQAISATALDQRLNLTLPDDEVGRLARTFDQMLDGLEKTFLRQKRFIADASHEMRTPLTILKGDVEVALNRPRTAEQYRQTLEMVDQTADQLNSLVEELLLLARADNHQYQLTVDGFNLAELIQQQVSHLTPHAERAHITLHQQTPEMVWIEADEGKLGRLLINLIDNAIKYGTPGGSVKVSAEQQVNTTNLIIADTGPGIAPEDISHLFERFYRADKARSRAQAAESSSSGAGLGLSIVQWIVDLHEGEIQVESELGRGTTFTVRLPNSAQPHAKFGSQEGRAVRLV